jgi:DNA (cytosine-5)-methyltransferase 1
MQLSIFCAEERPCQSFSNAGLRAGLDDPRGQLMLTFGAIAAKYRPRWLVWENVPGVLSSNGGRDFGAFLGLLGFLGYGFAYRVLDAQFVRVDGRGRAVPQRRNRVFVVGCLGDWRSAAAVLLERESLRGDPAPRRRPGADAAIGTLAGAGPGSGWRIGADEAAAGQLVVVPAVAATITAQIGEHTGQDARNGNLIAHAFDARQSDVVQYGDIAGPLDTDAFSQAIVFDPTQITSRENRSNPQPGDPCHTLSKGMHAPVIAFKAGAGSKAGSVAASSEVSPTLGACPSGNNSTPSVATRMRVRRLTPTECERLMGFPDGYTAITWRGKPAADGPRYKALGNSWATNCARWVGRRIAIVDSLRKAAA